MTAEIAIMNSMAIALAADSAVTIGHRSGQKIYNTVNKLFMLSAYYPVGIMVYGSAELMHVPWESVVKSYRRKLGDKAFDHLEDYASDFLEFLEKDAVLFSPEAEKRHFEERVSALFAHIRKQIENAIKAKIRAESVITADGVRRIIDGIVRDQVRECEHAPVLPHVGADAGQRIARNRAESLKCSKRRFSKSYRCLKERLATWTDVHPSPFAEAFSQSLALVL